MTLPNSAYGIDADTLAFYNPAVWDSINAQMQFGPRTALDIYLAQLDNASRLQGIQAQSASSAQASAASAGAQVASAGINAQGGIAQQQIASGAQLQGIQAQIAADLEGARQGDIAAAQRLQANLQLLASQSNQQTGLTLSQLGGSGQLRDYMARQNYLYGGGAQPGAFSSMQGLPSPWITAPQVGLPPMYTVPKVGSLPSAKMPEINIPSFGGGGGGFSGGGGGAPDYASLVNMVNQAIAPQTPVFDFAPPAPAPAPVQSATGGLASALTASITGNPAQSASNTQAAWQQILANQDNYLAGGGTAKEGQSVIVGDAPGGRLTPFSEVLTVKNGKVTVTPITGAAQGGGVLSTLPKEMPDWKPIPLSDPSMLPQPSIPAPALSGYDPGVRRPVAGGVLASGGTRVPQPENPLPPSSGTTVELPDGTTVKSEGPGQQPLNTMGATPQPVSPATGDPLNPSVFPWLNQLTGASPFNPTNLQPLRQDIPGAPGYGETIPMPWEVAYGAQRDPFAGAQYLDLVDALGLPRSIAQSLINTFTPGYRQGFNFRPLGF